MKAAVQRRVADEQAVVDRAVDQIERDLEVEVLAQLAGRDRTLQQRPPVARGWRR